MLDLEAIKQREAAATPGPWVLADGSRGFTPGCTIFEGDNSGRVIAYTASMGASLERLQADGAFIAHAREDVPALVAEIERLRTALEQEALEGH